MYSEDDKRIYQYQDGSRDTEGNLVTVYADPLEIDRAMSAACGGDVDETIDLCREYETDAAGNLVIDPETKRPRRIQLPQVVAESYQKLCAAIRSAFGLKPFDRLSGQGATTAVCIRRWNDYSAWVEKKDSPAVSSLTSPPVSQAA